MRAQAPAGWAQNTYAGTANKMRAASIFAKLEDLSK
jgi:hypothetical protein